jgi:hypothetical protein
MRKDGTGRITAGAIPCFSGRLARESGCLSFKSGYATTIGEHSELFPSGDSFEAFCLVIEITVAAVYFTNVLLPVEFSRFHVHHHIFDPQAGALQRPNDLVRNLMALAHRQVLKNVHVNIHVKT